MIDKYGRFIRTGSSRRSHPQADDDSERERNQQLIQQDQTSLPYIWTGWSNSINNGNNEDQAPDNSPDALEKFVKEVFLFIYLLFAIIIKALVFIAVRVCFTPLTNPHTSNPTAIIRVIVACIADSVIVISAFILIIQLFIKLF